MHDSQDAAKGHGGKELEGGDGGGKEVAPHRGGFLDRSIPMPPALPFVRPSGHGDVAPAAFAGEVSLDARVVEDAEGLSLELDGLELPREVLEGIIANMRAITLEALEAKRAGNPIDRDEVKRRCKAVVKGALNAYLERRAIEVGLLDLAKSVVENIDATVQPPTAEQVAERRVPDVVVGVDFASGPDRTVEVHTSGGHFRGISGGKADTLGEIARAKLAELVAKGEAFVDGDDWYLLASDVPRDPPLEPFFAIDREPVPPGAYSNELTSRGPIVDGLLKAIEETREKIHGKPLRLDAPLFAPPAIARRLVLERFVAVYGAGELTAEELDELTALRLAARPRAVDEAARALRIALTKAAVEYTELATSAPSDDGTFSIRTDDGASFLVSISVEREVPRG